MSIRGSCPDVDRLAAAARLKLPRQHVVEIAGPGAGMTSPRLRASTSQEDGKASESSAGEQERTPIRLNVLSDGVRSGLERPTGPVARRRTCFTREVAGSIPAAPTPARVVERTRMVERARCAGMPGNARAVPSPVPTSRFRPPALPRGLVGARCPNAGITRPCLRGVSWDLRMFPRVKRKFLLIPDVGEGRDLLL